MNINFEFDKIKTFFGKLSFFKFSNGIDRAKVFLNALLAYLSIIGIISFSLFICQEGSQMLSFANFSCSDTRSYHLMKQNLEVMSGILDNMRVINKPLYVLNPFQHLAYKNYIAATAQYIKTLEAEVLANAPDLFVGQEIEFDFKYQTYSTAKNNLFVLSAQKIKCIVSSPPSTPVIHIKGTALPDPDKAGGIIIINRP